MFQDIKKYFDPGGYEKKNICNQDTVTEQAEHSGMYYNQFEGKQQVEKEVEFRCPAGGEIGNKQPNEGATEITGQTIALGKLKVSLIQL